MAPNMELLIGDYSSQEPNSHRKVPGHMPESHCPILSVSPEHALLARADVPCVPVDFTRGPGVL